MTTQASELVRVKESDRRWSAEDGDVDGDNGILPGSCFETGQSEWRKQDRSERQVSGQCNEVCEEVRWCCGLCLESRRLALEVGAECRSSGTIVVHQHWGTTLGMEGGWSRVCVSGGTDAAMQAMELGATAGPPVPRSAADLEQCQTA